MTTHFLGLGHRKRMLLTESTMNAKVLCLIALFLLTVIIPYNSLAQSRYKLHNGETVIKLKQDSFLGIQNTAGEQIVPFQYSKIYIDGDFFFCRGKLQSETDFYEVYDWKGNRIISEKDEHRFLEATCINGVWWLTDSVKKIIRDEHGKIVYKYRLERDSEGFYSLINEVADTVVVESGQYTSLSIYGAFIKSNVGGLNGQEGILSMDGKTIIPATMYKSIRPTTDANVEVQGFIVSLSPYGKGKVGYLDLSGKCIIPAVNFTSVILLKNGLFEVCTDGKAGIADSSGRVLFMTKYHGLSPRKNDQGEWEYVTYLGNGRGLIDKDGNVIEEPKPTKVKKAVEEKSFSYVVVLDEKGKYGIETPKGKTIIPCKYEHIFYDKYVPGFRVMQNGHEGLHDINGKVIIHCDKYDDLNTINYPYIQVGKFGKYGLCNSKGKEIIKPAFDALFLREEDGIVNVDNGLYKGVVDFSGKVIVPVEFTQVLYRGDKRYSVGLFGKNGYYHESYKLVVPPKYSMVVSHNKPCEYYLVQDGETEGCYSYDGKMLFPTGLFRSVHVVQTEEQNYPFLIEAYNSASDQSYYYDFQGNLVRSSAEDSEFYKISKEANQSFDKKDYESAISLYRKALSIKEDATVFFNLGLSYYNVDDYSSALKCFYTCREHTLSDNLKQRSNRLIDSCNSLIKDQKRKERSDFWLGLATDLLQVAAAVATTNANISMYNNAIPISYSTPYTSPMSFVAPTFSAPVVPKIDWDEWAKNYEAEKESFLAAYRENFKASNGRIPNKEEEDLAFLQYLQAKNASMSNNINSSSSSIYDTYNYSTSSSSGTSTSTVSSRRCGLCGGTGTTVESVPTFGIVEKEYCSTCGKMVYSGHYHQTCKLCHGTGMESTH